MYIYLPIAELSLNLYALIGLGGLAGLLAGMFGIGGGFLLTPILMFMGVPAPVAVATSANQIIASSLSGFLSHRRHQRVDFTMGNVLVSGGFIGAILGITLFRKMQKLGQADLMVNLLYICFLSIVGALMLRDAWRTHRQGNEPVTQLHLEWAKRLPLQLHFKRSDVTHSLFLPMAIGVLTGLLVAVIGIGGGFIMLPAMIYLLHMPNNLTVGTSLYHIMLTTIFATLLHATTTHTVDVVLASLLVIGSVVGAHYGARISQKLPTYKLRALLALMLVFLALRLAYGLFITPNDLLTLDIRP